MQKTNPHWPSRRRAPERRGADAAFAEAMARSEFGKNYTNDRQQAEVRRSLARARARLERSGAARTPSSAGQAAAEPKRAETRDCARQPKADNDPRAAPIERFMPWRMPTLREQRQRIAEGKARMLARRKPREEKGEPQ